LRSKISNPIYDKNIPQKNTSVNTQNEKSLKNVPKSSINVDKSNSANYNESEQYGVMWTLESGVLNKKEIAQFYTKVAETKKQNYKNYVVSNDGEYIFSVGNKLIYTDSDYDYPEINRVVEFDTNSSTLFEYLKKRFLEYERDGYEIQDVDEIINSMQGKEIIKRTDYRDYEADRSKADLGRKGRTGKGNSSDSRENEVKQSGIAPTKETKFSIKNEKLEKEMENYNVDVKKSSVNKGISIEDVKAIQSIGRKSVNDFTSEDIKKTKAFAIKYWKEMGVKSPFFRAWFGD